MANCKVFDPETNQLIEVDATCSNCQLNVKFLGGICYGKSNPCHRIELNYVS